MRDSFSTKSHGNSSNMLLRRMAVRPFLLSALWLTTSPMLALAGSGVTFTLAPEIAAVVPQCASGCLQTFLEANYSPLLCGTQPSLRCLCPRVGTSGFTLGEGALACLVLENDRGGCAGMGLNSKVATKAYAMCNGQPGAAPATHSTILATMVLPSNSRAAPSVVPTSLPTTLLTATRTPTFSQVQPTIADPTTTVTGGNAAAQTTPADKSTLSGSQIAGIALGAAGAIVVILAILVLARGCRRSRQQENTAGTFAKMRDSWSLSRKSDWSPQMLQISAPVNLRPPGVDGSRAPRAPPSPPNRGAGRNDAIGLAISLQGSAAAASPQSRLRAGNQAPPRGATPPKPALTLTIPQSERGPQLPAPPPIASMARDSIVTEFAEDGDGDSQGGTHIWRPPASADPLSAATYYVADKWGNWVLGNPNRRSRVAELEGSSPLATKNGPRYPPPPSQAQPAAAVPPASRAAPAMIASRPQPAQVMMPSKPQPAQLGPAIQFRPQLQTAQTPPSRSSSIYSNYSLPSTVTPGPTNPMPPVLPPPNSYEQLIQNAAARQQPRRKSSRGLDRSDSKVSELSVTTIASSTADAAEYATPDGAQEQTNLSPVVESPRSAGVSPVTYPRIPGRSDRLTLFPAPALGDMRRSPASTASPGPSPARKPVPLNLSPARKPLPRDFAQAALESPTPAPLQIRGLPHQQVPRGAPQAQPQPYRQPAPMQAEWGMAGRQSPVVPPRGASQDRSSTPTSHVSTSSSLLAKRVGAERAAALLLGSEARPSQGGKWKRQPTANPVFMLSPEAALATPPRPGGRDGDIPRSPAWNPKLTPTRRGDDLYLNVQSGLSDH